MTQQNEAIRLAVEKLGEAEKRHQKIRNALDFIRYGSFARKDKDSNDGQAMADAGNNLSAAMHEVTDAISSLRPLLDQASAGVGDGRHQWDRDGERCVKCGDKDWMNDPVCKGHALTQADQPADKDDRREALAFCEMVEEIGMPDDTVIPVWPIDTEMAVTHPLTVGMVKTMCRALSGSDGRE